MSMVQPGAEFLDGCLSMDKLALSIVPGGLRPDDLAPSVHRITQRGCRRVGIRSKTETSPYSGFHVIAFSRRRVGESAKCHGNCFHRWVIILPADRVAKVPGLRSPPAGPRGGDPETKRPKFGRGAPQGCSIRREKIDHRTDLGLRVRRWPLLSESKQREQVAAPKAFPRRS